MFPRCECNDLCRIWLPYDLLEGCWIIYSFLQLDHFNLVHSMGNFELSFVLTNICWIKFDLHWCYTWILNLGTFRCCNSNDQLWSTPWQMLFTTAIVLDFLGNGFLGTQCCNLHLSSSRCWHGWINYHSRFRMFLWTCCFLSLLTKKSRRKPKQLFKPQFWDYCFSWINLLVDVLAIIQWSTCRWW